MGEVWLGLVGLGMATTVAERLEEAEGALHDILRGVAVRELRDQNGESVQYSRPDIPRLQAYIESLKRQAATAPTSGPLHIWF